MTGKVYLVGAGPGPADLISVKGLNLLTSADAVVHDRLVSQELLGQIPDSAEVINVGKTGHGPSFPQDKTNSLLVELAEKFKKTVRLKGGDPFIFGRGGEEALYLRERNVPFEIVPGITAAQAAGALSGVPLTHRGVSPQVTFFTGNEDPQKPGGEVDYANLAASKGTLAVYMGVSNLSLLSEKLISLGKPAKTPVCFIHRAGWPEQKIVDGTLGSIADRVEKAGTGPPAIVLIGEAAGLREKIAWHEKLPLAGKTVVVTRTRKQASELSGMLREYGASVIEFPTIRIQPRKLTEQNAATIKKTSGFDWLVFTSPNGTDCFFELLFKARLDTRSLGQIKIAAIGPGTAKSLGKFCLRADLVPEKFVAESLLEGLKAQGVEGKKILIPRAAETRDVLEKGLEQAGAKAEVLSVYDTVLPEVTQMPPLEKADAVTFTSSSTVRNFVKLVGKEKAQEISEKAALVSIGPITSATLKEEGLQVHAEAKQSTIPDMVRAMLEKLD